MPIFRHGAVVGIMDVEAFAPGVFAPREALGTVLGACAGLAELLSRD